MNPNIDLSKKIEEATLAAIEDGTIDRDSLRQIVIGVSKLGDVILLWSFDDWSNYPYAEEDKAYAKISNADWLDRWDALSDPTSEKADPLRPQLRAQIHEAIRNVILDQSLGEFSNLVGFAEYRLNPHVDIEHGTPASFEYDECEGEVFAFYHPHGAGPIVGIMEKIPPGHLIYPFGSFFEDGIALFYPEGKQDSLSGSDQSPGVKILSFQDVEAWWNYDDYVMYRSKNEPLSIGLTSGHTHEEWGQPDRKEIERMIERHFLKSAPHLQFISETLPDIENLDAVADWRNRLERYDIYPYELIRKFYPRFGFKTTLRFAASFQNQQTRTRSISTLAWSSIHSKRHQEALDALSELSADQRLEEWRIEIHALIALHRFEETIQLVAKLREAMKIPRKGHRLADEEDILPWELIALLGVGRKEEVSAKLASIKKEDEKINFVRAVILQDSNLKEAQSYLLKAIRSDILNLNLEQFIVEPQLKKLISLTIKVEQRKEKAKLRDLEIGRFEKEAEIKPLQIESSEIRRKTSKQWKTSFEFNLKDKLDSDRTKTICKQGSNVWIIGPNGLLCVETKEPNKISVNTAVEGKFRNLAIAGNYLYATCSEGLKIFNISNAASPVSHGTVPRFDKQEEQEIAIGEGVVATLSRDVCTLYSITNPARPTPLSYIQLNQSLQDYMEGLAIKGNILFLSTDERRIVCFDISDLANPRCVSSLQLAWNGERGYGDLRLLDDLIVMKISGGVWLIDVSNPQNPRSLAAFSIDQSLFPVRKGNKLYLIDKCGIILILNLDTLEFEEKANTILMDGKKDEDYDPRRGIFLDEKLLLLSPKKISLLTQAEIPSYPDPTPHVFELEETLKEKIEEELAEVPEEFTAGLIILRRYRGSFRLILDTPRSFVGINSYREELIEIELELGDLSDSPYIKDYAENKNPAEIADPDSLNLFQLRLEDAYNELAQKILNWLPSSEEFLRIASGKVYICNRTNDKIELVNTLIDEEKEWKPYRSEETEGSGGRSIDDLLSDFNVRERMTARAKEEPEVRERAHALAASGVLCALRIVEAIQEVDPTAAIETFQKTALTKSDCAEEAVEELAAYKDRPEVKIFLEDLIQTGRPIIQIEAALALGRADSDHVVELVKLLLKHDPSLESGGLYNAYEYDDLAIKATKAMQSRLGELQTHLLEWVRNNPNENRMGGIATSLFRSGYRILPPELVEQAKYGKSDEEYHTMLTGIPALDNQDWNQSKECEAERLFTGFRLAEYTMELRTKNDQDSSLWPPELPHEPWNASWSYVLDSAWSHLVNLGIVDWFENALGNRARKSSEIYLPDRKLLSSLLKRYSGANDLEATLRITDYFITAPEGVFKKKEIDHATKLCSWARVQLGFAFAKEGNLKRAKELATAALTADPSDGTALFLDARLIWLESNSPDQCIERAKQNLEKLAPDDEIGHGRLLNLVGCALDELKDWDQAAIWFEKAWKAHSSDPMYLSNLAEAHHKRGAKEEASNAARLAKRSGATEKILDEILGKKA
ncbi:hypothetical protein LEP1GSC036_4534 [Leptospira weilii str. 2006001853]|uniref:Tetratricopeptide repeat protein n=1 Tax=Leptospira weilii str. 2006001853 TaxID=1001589 RepID=A0A828Z3E7_9LEPT|nr:hypothetical protein [Leptospira weilii]EKR64817.1 hypothetical protein LEP1GSC036_4534 [Leptospira weilii str. 2006001853]EMN46207.1 hypothetical protein LEP1GSC086_2995 [Leptospira weilii str. LNT 1234]QDK24367.1 hypothetical protein FHG67_17850 [Leptospira weilii]QDK28327.1 hypothetical protein FHG68_17905 [Leptospira weilii]